MAQIGAAVVGSGFIGMAHVEALRRCGVHVTGLVGSRPERAQPKAQAAGIGRVYANLDEALADPEVSVVHVATPNHLHVEQARRALNAGKHVVCEKPLGLTSSETAELVADAEQRDLVAAVCLNVRFYPLLQQLRAMIAGDELGTPRFVTGSYLQDWLLEDTDWNWRLVPEEAGALRAVADIGSHWLDLAQFVVGQPIVEVMADLHTFVPVRRHPEGPVETFAAAAVEGELVEEPMSSDDAAGILLRFANGARGTLGVSQVSAGRKNAITIEVDGSESAAAWYSEEPDQLWIGHRGRPNEQLARDPGLLAPAAAAVSQYPGGHVEGYPDTFRGLFSRVYADVARGSRSAQPDYPTFADGHDVLRVTEAIARSTAERRWVAVDRGKATS